MDDEVGSQGLCIEPADKLAIEAVNKGLVVHQLRLQDYHEKRKFDAIVAISSLIHVPKSEMKEQIKKLYSLLNEKGVLLLSFLEGDGEFYEDPTDTGQLRFFSKFKLNELEEMFSHQFLTVENLKVEVKRMGQSFFLMVLKAK